MKTIKILSVIMCLSMIMCTAVFSEGGDAKAEIPYADKKDSKTSAYWYKQMDIYEGDEAVKAGVPFGYSGYVMRLVGDTSAGITVDFTGRNIPVTSVKALHMRVYYNEKQREVRVTVDAGVSWVLRHEAKKPGQWEDVVISDQASLRKLADQSGRLGVFGFGFRCYEGTSNTSVYIDEIRVELIDDDGMPPVIEYDGPDRIETTEGKPFFISARAWDELEKAEFPIEYIWSGDAVDEEGKLKKGEYELTLRSSDSGGNTSEKKLTVAVGDRDTTPPVIGFRTDKIETVAGAYVKLVIKAEDDCDEVTVTQSWSEGALDVKGRITEGVHTLTLTSSDLTGNTSTLTVTVAANDTLR
ncbi:MAG: hypothetical protein II135_06650 [Clostridia bacterium]|nr:hypothetical protein [Clostridia bacterium]